MAQQHINRSSPNDGLGDTLYNQAGKIEDNFTELYGNKVDKVNGKGLSDTNYTQAEKDKLAGLVTGGQVQSDMTEEDNTKPSYIKNKFTKTSDFTNDGDGTEVFVTDVGEVGTFARSAGGWVAIPGNISLQSIRFAGSGQNYTLPETAIAFKAWINDGVQHKEQAGFESDLNTFTQLGDVVTFKKTITAGQRIIIDYYI